MNPEDLEVLYQGLLSDAKYVYERERQQYFDAVHEFYQYHLGRQVNTHIPFSNSLPDDTPYKRLEVEEE